MGQAAKVTGLRRGGRCRLGGSGGLSKVFGGWRLGAGPAVEDAAAASEEPNGHPGGGRLPGGSYLSFLTGAECVSDSGQPLERRPRLSPASSGGQMRAALSCSPMLMGEVGGDKQVHSSPGTKEAEFA